MARALSRREFLVGAAAAAGALALVPARVYAEPQPGFGSRALDQFIRERMRIAHTPGLGVAVVADGGAEFTAGYGLANLRTGERVTPDTPFMLASVSKTVMCTTLMQLVERGKCELDADVDRYLSFDVRNPRFPDVAITPRMLLTHTSSIRDRPDTWHGLYARGDSRIPLGGFLESYLVPGGTRFERENFYERRPGAEYHYSNVAAALAGFLAEAITHVPFDRYCEQHIFGPLGMDRTSWHLSGLPRVEVAMPYHFRTRHDRYAAYGQYGYPDYPDGELRSSAHDLARFLLMFMNGGELGGVRILKASTVEEIRRSQIPRIVPWSQGLIWYWHHHDRNGYRLLGHNGGDKGVSTQMFCRPDRGTGVIVLANSDVWSHREYRALLEVRDRLFSVAGCCA